MLLLFFSFLLYFSLSILSFFHHFGTLDQCLRGLNVLVLLLPTGREQAHGGGAILFLFGRVELDRLS
jgi:hypothetical protein